MPRRPLQDKYLKYPSETLDLAMAKNSKTDKKPTSRYSAVGARALTSYDLYRGGVPPIKESHKDPTCFSTGNLPSEGIKKSWFLFMRAMERETGTLEDNTDARMLFSAVRKGKIRLAKFIMDAASVDVVNSRDFRGKTPLIIACSMKEELSRDLMVSLLLNYDADVNLIDDDGRTALSHACEKRCNDIVDILVKQANVDPDIQDKDGNTALIYCAKVGNDVAIDILTRHFRRLGLDVDHINKEGYTALLLAAKQGNITCAKLLIEHGHASLLHRDKTDGLTAQEWLIKNGFTWDDIAPLTARMRSRARFMRAINAARVTSLHRVREASTKSLKIPSNIKVGKATYPTGTKMEHIPAQPDSEIDSSDVEFARLIARGHIARRPSLNNKMKLPKIQISGPKKSTRRGSKVVVDTSDESDERSEEEEEEDVDLKKGDRRSYRPHFSKTRSQATLEEILPYDSQ